MIDCLFCSPSWDPGPNLVTEAGHWQVVPHEDQHYLGRCTVVLTRHCRSLNDLDSQEWADLKLVVESSEAALHDLFGAEPFNWACLMNGGYRADPPEPHVHFHLWPRYRQTVRFHALTFTDEEFGRHYDHTKSRVLPGETRTELVRLLRDRLAARQKEQTRA